MHISQEELKAARKRLNLTTKKAAQLLHVSEHRFQRWEGQTASENTIPWAYWELFQLLTDTHPRKKLADKD
jgi:DNA-binding transcriptional regulator YiaG